MPQSLPNLLPDIPPTTDHQLQSGADQKLPQPRLGLDRTGPLPTTAPRHFWHLVSWLHGFTSSCRWLFSDTLRSSLRLRRVWRPRSVLLLRHQPIRLLLVS